MKLPKFYNPFKAHVIELANAKFAVRKRILIGWVYKERETWSNDEIHWWYQEEYIKKYCIVDTLEDAIRLRDKVKINPMKAMKVIHG